MKQIWNKNWGKRSACILLASTMALSLTAFAYPEAKGKAAVQAPGIPLTIKARTLTPVSFTEPTPEVNIEQHAVPTTYAPAASEYDNKAVANVTNALNLRSEPSVDGELLGKCYRGAGGEILEQRDGWTRIKSGSLEGWVSDDYLVFGKDIEPLARELGLITATVTAETLRVRSEPSTEASIVGLANADDYYPVLEEADGWAKIQLSAEDSGYISSDFTNISLTIGKAVSIEAERAALKAAEEGQKEAAVPAYVINASSEDIYLLASCVMMEAGGYSYDGQLAVANVIVNRVKSGRWGKSISDVIYAKGQFPGATSGLLDKYLTKGPSKSALKAANAALTGTNNIGDYLFFNSTKAADYSSYSSYTVVGGNCFYKK